MANKREFPLAKTRNIGIMAHIDAVRLLLLNVSFTTLVRSTKLVKLTKVIHKWTGWMKKGTWYHHYFCSYYCTMERPQN